MALSSIAAKADRGEQRKEETDEGNKGQEWRRKENNEKGR